MKQTILFPFSFTRSTSPYIYFCLLLNLKRLQPTGFQKYGMRSYVRNYPRIRGLRKRKIKNQLRDSGRVRLKYADARLGHNALVGSLSRHTKTQIESQNQILTRLFSLYRLISSVLQVDAYSQSWTLQSTFSPSRNSTSAPTLEAYSKILQSSNLSCIHIF